MRVHKLTFAALAVAAGLSLTACQSGNDNAGNGHSDPSSTSSASTGGGSGSDSNSSSTGGGSGTNASDRSGTSTGTGTSSGSGSKGSGKTAGSGSGTGASARTGKCLTAGLKITAQDGTIGGDTDGTVVVTLTNRSGHDCTVAGYAGVDLKTNAGSLSAKRTGQETVSAVLKNGESTYFPVSYPLNTSGGSGVRITGLVVTPPDETHSVTLAWPGAASLPVTDGSGSSVKVGPIGSAGQGG
ncbi:MULTISPECIES: DUF4232 domain-containing protein [unclassified Streptomyces]|uniref:DUF4232 domain-containing protein n=1 Tax=unclassified Streptomyces TaxID=2593676 RepID=UPI002E2DB414|nr:DUF4232 domain-containing protein [Streptomyces sp. NBC_00228]